MNPFRSAHGRGAPIDLVEERLSIAGVGLELLRPVSGEALLDEEAFEREEYLPYWAELWPSALALAEVVAAEPPGGRVLEIGCGLGVPALVAARGGADVVAADWSQDAVRVLRENAARNGAAVDVRRWSWTEDPAPLGGPFGLVLAADVLYERRNVPQLLEALPCLAAEVWLADPGRRAAEGFLEGAAARWALDVLPHGGPPQVTVHRLRRRGESAP